MHDIRFVEDNWESPTLGAWGLGWKLVKRHGSEPIHLLSTGGGLECYPVTGELTYGLERIAMYLQGVESVYDLIWAETAAGKVSYGDVYHQNEVEMSTFNFLEADVDHLFSQFEFFEREALRLAQTKLPLPAYEHVMKASHTFNLLDARHAIVSLSGKDTSYGCGRWQSSG